MSTTPLKVEEEVMEKQGIVSILGSDDSGGTKPAAASFRRTLSADMSSKKWLAQNGFKSPNMKKIASYQQLSVTAALDSSATEEDNEEFDGKKLNENPKQDDVWSSIISQNKTQELPPPYVHPLVKKSSSTLSEKSLEICTEGLGSETGSDGFSSNPSSETSSEEDDDSNKVEDISQSQKCFDAEESQLAVPKYNYPAATSKKVQPRAFPPPLSSLTRSSQGPSLHMHSHRENGRLVLAAFSVPSTKNFQAQRQDGRLRLTLLNNQEKSQQPKHDKVEEGLEEMLEIFEKEEEEIEIEENDEEEMDEEIEENKNKPHEIGIVMEEAGPKVERGLINVHRSAWITKKLMGLENKNFNYNPAKLVKVDVANEEETTQLPRSLPPRPRLVPSTPAAAAAALNAYEYFWRTKPTTASQKSTRVHHCSPLKTNTNNNAITSNKPTPYEQQELVVLRKCKEAQRSLLGLEPYCIATS